MVLVDTSVWVAYLRGEPTAQDRALKDLLAGEEIVGMAPVILQEILQGADSIAAPRLYQTCRRAGKTPRSSNDCLIAQIALEHDLALLHDERDFEAIASAVAELKLYSTKNKNGDRP